MERTNSDRAGEKRERERKSSKKMRKLQFLSILHRKFSTDSPHIIEPIDWLSFSFLLFIRPHNTERGNGKVEPNGMATGHHIDYQN